MMQPTNEPVVSVIMPVYNAGKYLQKAIDSVLQQTFARFQLIVVNDCSTDNSHDIIVANTDVRIIYLQQPKNMGVVAAMNRGLEQANTPYTAVMHADDICYPERLQRQVDYLDKHPKVAVVAAFANNIDEQDNPVATVWQEDRDTQTPEQIHREMIIGNCITHPTVMMRTDMVKHYGYTSSPRHMGYAVEDYPLWLHLLSDGYAIGKITEPLLFYRVHQQSATGTFLRSRNPFFVNYYSKQFYLQQRRQKGALNSFDKAVQSSMYLDFCKGTLKSIKQRILK